MDAIKLLKAQHAEVDALFEKYDQLSERAKKTKLQLFEQIADRLAAHNTIEERIFYPSVKTDDTEDELLESLEEHLSAKRVIADLLETSIQDETFDAKMSVLKELFRHHRREEERELLPQVKKALDSDKLEELGERMEALFDSLIDKEPRREVPRQTDSAPPLR
jgi:hemerythrin superfamily protein